MPVKISQNTHYVPEWLLSKFRKPFLYELDIFTGTTERRNPKTAASEVDMWPEDIEDGLSEHDNNAAQIFRRKISNQTRIVLTEEDRRKFSLWLAHFYIRAPKRRESAAKYLEEQRRNPASIVTDAIHHNREHFLEDFRKRNPEFYAEAIRDAGQASADEQILSAAVEYWSNTENLPWPNAEAVHQSYMRLSDTERFGEILRRYRWTWLRTTSGFVIGDHPLISWHAQTGRWDYGIERAGAEITMPLSVNISLFLTQDLSPESAELLECDALTTRRFNCRQRMAATKHVFGNSPGLLDFITQPILL